MKAILFFTKLQPEVYREAKLLRRILDHNKYSFR